ncbi:MAG TPA: hypothetical protein QKA08_04200 [Candidatus Megaira endosymbiont of Nemacystus decipiens]|nr:hypothetical protein [Candidatus Megaera endosymbiont of Nemacystus decipiens]
MIEWKDLKKKIDDIKENKIIRPDYAVKKGEFNDYDNFALLIKGGSVCTSVYLQKNGELKICANTKNFQGREILQQLEIDYDENALGYANAFKEPDLEKRNTELRRVLANDTRLENGTYENLKSIKDIFAKLEKKLAKNLMDVNYCDASKTLEKMKRGYSEFLGHIQNLDITLDQIFLKFHVFKDQLNEDVSKIRNEGKFKLLNNRSLRRIPTKLDHCEDKDLNFLKFLDRLMKNEGNILDTPLVKSIYGYDPVIEVRQDQIHDLVITLDDSTTYAYHTEHILGLNIEEQNKSDENYIGISKLCCSICHYVVRDMQNYNVAGTHGDYCSGSALVGLGLHEKQEQQEILRGLFPNMMEIDNDKEKIETSVLSKRAYLDSRAESPNKVMKFTKDQLISSSDIDINIGSMYLNGVPVQNNAEAVTTTQEDQELLSLLEELKNENPEDNGNINISLMDTDSDDSDSNGVMGDL